jgi:hypothetical protein
LFNCIARHLAKEPLRSKSGTNGMNVFGGIPLTRLPPIAFRAALNCSLISVL